MVVNSAIKAIGHYLPKTAVSNADLAAEFPEWGVEKIQAKTGIERRHVAAPGECSSDLAFCAATNLFRRGACSPAEIDYLLFCTQTPDYFLPTTACLLQERLGIPTTAGALDFNLGCSGYVYGLGLAQGLIQSGQARNILFLTAETYSKFIDPRDRNVRTVFGDGAAATLIGAAGGSPCSARYVFGTDGRGAPHLIVPTGGMRQAPAEGATEQDADSAGETMNRLHMNGAEVFNFTLEAVPACIGRLLAETGQALDAIDLFVFHQANEFMLDHLRRKLEIPRDRFYVHLASCGNTTSSSIPIALEHAVAEGRLREGHLVMLVGFGVGYSWGATLIQWPYLGYSAVP